MVPIIKGKYEKQWYGEREAAPSGAPILLMFTDEERGRHEGRFGEKQFVPTEGSDLEFLCKMIGSRQARILTRRYQLKLNKEENSKLIQRKWLRLARTNWSDETKQTYAELGAISEICDRIHKNSKLESVVTIFRKAAKKAATKKGRIYLYGDEHDEAR
jgi:hypothetical protein